MAFTSGNDVNILQSTDTSFVGAGFGDDKYILSGTGMLAGQTINITDVDGANSLQLIGGLSIASSKITYNVIQLNLSNGAIVNILGADTFTFEVGGNPLTGTAGVLQTFSQFVTTSLGLLTPPTSTSGVVNGQANVDINSNGTTTTVGGTTVLAVGTSVPVAATAAADVFSFSVAAAKASAPNTQIDLTGFAVAADSLVIDTTTALGQVNLSALNGVDGITVQSNAITQSTVINFGNDANGDVIIVSLAGVADASMVSVNIV